MKNQIIEKEKSEFKFDEEMSEKKVEEEKCSARLNPTNQSSQISLQTDDLRKLKPLNMWEKLKNALTSRDLNKDNSKPLQNPDISEPLHDTVETFRDI